VINKLINYNRSIICSIRDLILTFAGLYNETLLKILKSRIAVYCEDEIWRAGDRFQLRFIDFFANTNGQHLDFVSVAELSFQFRLHFNVGITVSDDNGHVTDQRTSVSLGEHLLPKLLQCQVSVRLPSRLRYICNAQPNSRYLVRSNVDSLHRKKEKAYSQALILKTALPVESSDGRIGCSTCLAMRRVWIRSSYSSDWLEKAGHGNPLVAYWLEKVDHGSPLVGASGSW